MKVAITSEDGKIFQHFGRTPEFAVFEIESGKIIDESVLPSGDSAHGALAVLLKENNINTLICGGIGGGAMNALSSLGISVIAGIEGSVRDAAQALAENRLEPTFDFTCKHHEHGDSHDGNCHCH